MKKNFDTKQNIVEANLLDKINFNITTKTKGWENHPDIKAAEKELETTQAQWTATKTTFTKMKDVIDDYEATLKSLEDKYKALTDYRDTYIEANGQAFAHYKGTKAISTYKTRREFILYITASCHKYHAFYSPREFMNAIVESVNKVLRLEAWEERNKVTNSSVKELANTLFSWMLSGEHKKILNHYSKFFQVQRDNIYQEKGIAYSELMNKYESVKADISTAESKLGWSTAFFTILISILVTIGTTLSDVSYIWYIVGPCMVLPIASFLILIWGMTHARSKEFERLIDEEKMLFLARDENRKEEDGVIYDWQSESGRAIPARIIDNSLIDKKAKKYLVESSLSVTYEKEKLLLLIKQFRAISKRKTRLANFASSLTFWFPFILMQNPGKIHDKDLKHYSFNDDDEVQKD